MTEFVSTADDVEVPDAEPTADVPDVKPAADVPDDGAKTYEVTGVLNIHGHDPGETFTKALDPVNEEALIASGNLKVVA